MWLEITKWVAITFIVPFLLFLLAKFYQDLKPSRGEEWHDQIDRHIREADRLIERFIAVEARLKGLEKEVAGNQVLAIEERRQILRSIGDLHDKLDKLMERLLDRASNRPY